MTSEAVPSFRSTFRPVKCSKCKKDVYFFVEDIYGRVICLKCWLKDREEKSREEGDV